MYYVVLVLLISVVTAQRDIDPWYLEGGDAATRCHNMSADHVPDGYKKCLEDAGGRKAGPFGHYCCPSPYRLVASAMKEAVSQVADVDFVLWTGDDTPMPSGFPFPSTDLHMTQDKVLAIVANVTNILRDAFPNSPVWPTVGNHINWPPSQFHSLDDAKTKKILNTVADLWTLPSSADAEMRSLGSFSTLIRPGLRLVSLNTLYCDRGNLLAMFGDVGDSNERVFDWLETTIEAAGQNNETIWIAGHVPLGWHESRTVCTDRLREMLKSTSTRVMGQIYGHTHTDSFTILRSGDNLKDEPLSVMHIAPAITPESWHDPGHNPSFRLWLYDRDTFELVDYWQYRLDLLESNEQQQPVWSKEYAALEDLGLPDLSAASMDALAQRAQEDDTVWKTLWDHYGSYRPGYACDEACKKEWLCGLRHAGVVGQKECELL